jgi:hypothetical protein
MHELGHTLGLDHGGNDDGHQWKPNYYSVMNYMWAIPRPGWQAPGSWRLDYSHKPGRDPYFSILNEQVLVEEDGLVDQAGPVPILTMPYTDANYDVRQARVEFGVPVDWNGDGVIQTAYQELDINEPFFGLKDCNNVTDLHTSPDELLVPKSDWEDLKYNFRSSPRFHPTNAVVTTGDAYAALRTTAGEFIPEPDAAKDAAFDRLPAPRPTGKFTMNGVLDASAVPLASNGGITLYGVYKPPQLYLATNAAAAQGGDMVVLLSDSRGTLRAAPLGKAGQAGAWKASLFGRASGDPAAWADGTETLMNSVSVDTSGTVLEGVVDVGLLFGKNPPNLYLALAKYAPGSGGALLAQAPVGNGDGNVDGAEFLQLNGVVGVPETPVTIAERVRVELLGAQPSAHGARIRLTLGVAGDVDITLQNVAGRRIARIAGGTYEAGVHDFTVATQMAPGVYFLVTRALGETRATRVVIVKYLRLSRRHGARGSAPRALRVSKVPVANARGEVHTSPVRLHRDHPGGATA